ncbi:META domain-containing protein [Rhodococcus spongiicola]|uniref:META domain-containing protein n=1 Tax=Rhodococcus spongiicola TaxID=2487352 RepID=A0A438B255_9NOCA|nr:META domain-containing protein [Rhodococcus spongiicola]RVW05011.1 META domain-containing protein [Rhodococcus spongiicola]
MRTLLVVLVLLSAAALNACGGAAESPPGTGETTPTGTMVPVAPVSPADGLWGRTFVSTSVTGTTIPGSGPLEVAFPERGQIAMSAGCNRGVSSVNLSGGVVRTGPIATTQMACDGELADADTWMIDLFASEPEWTLTEDGVLILSSPGVTITLENKVAADPDRPVVGTTWVVDTLISPDAITMSAALETAAPNLTITPDDRVTGSTGCGRLSGSAHVGDDTITFGRLSTTQTACSADVAEVAQSVVHVLRGEVAYSVNGGAMRLTGPDGYGLGLRGE